MTYWALNAIFLAIAVAVAIASRLGRRRPRLLPLAVTVLVLFVVSAVFDNVMIGVGLVGYDRDLISGAFLGIAPLEDFAYVVGAVLLLPALWYLLPARRAAARRAAARRAAGAEPPATTTRNSGHAARQDPQGNGGDNVLNSRGRRAASTRATPTPAGEETR